MIGCSSPNRNRWIILFIAIILGYFYQANQYSPQLECPIVNTTLGKVKGYTTLSRDGREYFGFLGIPFAAPPIGPLRFEPPQPAEKWTDVRTATNFGSDCAQINLILGFKVYDEDCLFLNVYTPARNLSDPISTKLFSVMVYFYGGMFMEGKSSMYGAKYFMDEDIVLVTVNYRVGALGFLNTGDGLIRGNMGLKDQNMALRWVQENIKFFGGKAEDVTIFGQSAGGAAVHYHMLSPMSQGLFSKAISQSGFALNPWALTLKPKEQAYRLGNFLNCSNHTMTELVTCLKSLAVPDILAAHHEVENILRNPLSVYTPTIETVNDSNAFIVEHPEDSLKNGRFSKIPWMAGVTADEGLIISSVIIRNESNIKNDFESLKSLAKKGLYYTKENKDLTEEVKQKYFGTVQSIQEYGKKNFFKSLTTLFSDRHFFNGFVNSIREHSKHAPTFAYFYNYTGGFSVTPMLLAIKREKHVVLEAAAHFISSWFNTKIMGNEPENYGVCHSDEISLLFSLSFFGIHGHSKDYAMSRAIINLWVTFAKLQNPSEGMEFLGTKWNLISPNHNPAEIKYLLIGNEGSKLITTPFGNRLEFWDARNQML